MDSLKDSADIRCRSPKFLSDSGEWKGCGHCRECKVGIDNIFQNYVSIKKDIENVHQMLVDYAGKFYDSSDNDKIWKGGFALENAADELKDILKKYS